MAKTVIVSYSELDTSRQCPFKHRLAYKERWTSPTTSPALAKGTLWHKVLESHYLRIKMVQDAGEKMNVRLMAEIAEEVVAEHLYDDLGNQDEVQALVEWMYVGYLELYNWDPQWRILAVEDNRQLWLPTDRGGRSRFKLKLKIDLVVRDLGNSHILVVDHKSGKDLPKDKELEIDDQFGLYTWALRSIGKDVFASIHSAARTQRNQSFQPLDERFRRKSMYRTDIELRNIAVEAYRAAKAAYGMKIGEEPRSPNPDTCKWKCNFTEPCLGSRKGMDLHRFLRDQGFVQDWTRH